MADVFRGEALIRFAHCDHAGIVFYPRYVETLNNVPEDMRRRIVTFVASVGAAGESGAGIMSDGGDDAAA